MKKIILSVVFTMLLSVCLTFALSADTQTVDINVEKPVDTEQQFRIYFTQISARGNRAFVRQTALP